MIWAKSYPIRFLSASKPPPLLPSRIHSSIYIRGAFRKPVLPGPVYTVPPGGPSQATAASACTHLQPSHIQSPTASRTPSCREGAADVPAHPCLPSHAPHPRSRPPPSSQIQSRPSGGAVAACVAATVSALESAPPASLPSAVPVQCDAPMISVSPVLS